MARRIILPSFTLASCIATVVSLLYGGALFSTIAPHNRAGELYNPPYSNNFDYAHALAVLFVFSGTLYIAAFLFFSLLICMINYHVPLLSKINKHVTYVHAVCLSVGLCVGVYKVIESDNTIFYEKIPHLSRVLNVNWIEFYMIFSAWFGFGFFGCACLVLVVGVPMFLISKRCA